MNVDLNRSTKLPLEFNKAVQIDSKFRQLIDEIKSADIHLPNNPIIVSGMIDYVSESQPHLITPLESDLECINIDLKSGHDFTKIPNLIISAYDESIAYYASIEGKVAYISHSLVTIYDDQYYPLNRLNLLFCTRSKLVHQRIPGSILSKDWDVDTTISVEIAKQKRHFLSENAIPNSILLIDGPFLAGSGSFTFYETIYELLEKSIIPIFIVKNSNATLLVDNLKELKDLYNSDLHYANEILNEGTRTPFFKYTSEEGNKSKVFCYLKFKEHYSPFRIEIPTVIFNEFREIIEKSMDLIYYLIKVQGSPTNPQVRPIAIAEMYARETLNLIDINKDSIQMKLTATMNERRGME